MFWLKSVIFRLVKISGLFWLNSVVFNNLLDCMWKAFIRRGLPVRIFTDNGSAMRDNRLQLGLADLDVQLTYSTAYRPQGKAKIERFWRTLRMQFLPTLPPEGRRVHAP